MIDGCLRHAMEKNIDSLVNKANIMLGLIKSLLNLLKIEIPLFGKTSSEEFFFDETPPRVSSSSSEPASNW